MDACDIRPASLEDAEAIAEIYGHYVRTTSNNFEYDPPDAAEIARRIAAVLEARLPYLVAEQQRRVVGFAYAHQFRPRPAYRFAVENSVYVDKDCVGRGIGHQLLVALMDRCREAGVSQMIAGMGGDHPASIAFHAAHGFELVGVFRKVGFKFDQWLDLTLMQRAL
jgi:L-amino acid N-acyltransferase YncA